MTEILTQLVLPVVDEGLGNSAYLVDLGDGRALAVDASHDLRALDHLAAGRGLRVVAAAETHLHADFLSGATRLAARDGAAVYASAAGDRLFPHIGLSDGDRVDLGGLTLRAWATPGHTGEHMSYLLLDGAGVLAVFTGGSLLVGSAARTDLSGADRIEELARAQFRSLQRFFQLPPDTAVLPTHGAGSFCSAPPGSARTTTIGREFATNPLLAAPDEDAFVQQFLASLGTFPPYFLHLGEHNRRGPTQPGPVVVSAVLPADVGATLVVDVRQPRAWAAAHVPGSLSIALRDQFSTWLGWMVPDPATPFVVLRDPEQDLDEVNWQARKIGYDGMLGELAGGISAWVAAGLPVTTTPLLTPAEVDTSRLVDVRQDSEFAAGHARGARNVELGALATTRLDGPVVMMCGHGERAATGASVLERAGHRDVAMVTVGPDAWP